MGRLRELRDRFRADGLHTVCESARCPNLGACWGRGVATFMILGGTCTRACRFCAVPAGRPEVLDPREPEAVADRIRQMGLRYAVVTSVARDDLPDEGAHHFAATVRAIRRLAPGTRVEVLIPDFSGREDCLRTVVEAGPDVIGHNIETVRRLAPRIRPQADHQRSLDVLALLKRLDPGGEIWVKSGFMVGLGETDTEIEALMRELRAAGCLLLTVGQYLSPTRAPRQWPVARFVEPERFTHYRTLGLSLGFRSVISGPVVRSSYIAEHGYREAVAAGRGG